MPRARAEMEQGPTRRQKDRARAEMEPGPTKKRKDCARAEMEQEQSKCDRARERRWKQRNTASEESKAKEIRV